MLINDVAKIVGMSQKAIRFYENKKLLRVSRTSNGYRDYSSENIETLNKIKLLRVAGVSIADIKLLFDGIVNTEELLKKRKKELEYEFGIRSKQVSVCEEAIQSLINEQYNNSYELEEKESNSYSEYSDSDELIVGIDIGTTTISASVMNLTKKCAVEYYTISNGADTETVNDMFYEQDADLIYKRSTDLLNSIVNTYENIKAIGVTGQMHGIVYLDNENNAVSPFVTWQDKRCDTIAENGITYCDKISEITGKKISTGYGLATHYYNVCNKMVPETAKVLCNITDYLVAKWTNANRITIHSSMAASFGLFDVKNICFSNAEIEQLGIDTSILPDVTDDYAVSGTYCNIPIAIPIGDNQASVLGTADDLENSILLNIGTGSQISTVINSVDSVNDDLEIRPLVKGKYILCGSALSGGASYALLENFFRSYMSSAGFDDSYQYDTMNKLAQKAYNENSKPLQINTLFKGKRTDKNSTGSIIGITDNNFTPENMVLGFICGMCRELYEFFDGVVSNKKCIIASGNAVQKNPIFLPIISDMFKIPTKLSINREEASTGASLFAAVATGEINSINDFEVFYNYSEELN